MRYRRLALMIVIIMALSLLYGMAAVGDENLFYNTEFLPDSNGAIDNWFLTEGAALTTKSDKEYGTVVQIDCKGITDVSLDQDVIIVGDTNYGIRFRARVVKGNGTIKAQIANYPSAQSIGVSGNEWTIVELYGKTEPETESIPISFAIENDGIDDCAVEIAQMEFVQTDQIPSDATYVWFYDRTAWETQNAQTEQAKSIQGFPYLLIIMLIYAGVAFGLSRLNGEKGTVSKRHPVVYVLLASFALSVVLSFVYQGHPTDINNFSAWAQQLANVGIPKFYTSGIWADYPPGYMYVLYFCGLLGKLFGVTAGHPLFTFFVKLPAILADIGCAYLIYRVARKHFNEKVSLFLCALMAINPLSLLDSAIWGQMDSVLTLLLVAALLFYFKGQKPICAAFLVLGVLVKPQMLVFWPLIFVAFMVDIFRDPKKGLISLGLSLLAGIGTLLVLVLPFSFGQSPLWLWKLYTNAANLYRYATVNAFNFYALLGMNWAPDSTAVLFGISAAKFGLFSIFILCGLIGFFYVRAKDKRSLIPLCGILMWGIFLFSQNMHERYLYPSVLLFLWTYAETKNRRFLFCSVWAMGVTFLNSGLVLFNESSLLLGSPFAVIITSLLNLVGFGYAIFSWIKRGKPLLAPQQKLLMSGSDGVDGVEESRPSFTLKRASREGEKMMRWDYIIMAAITLVYSVVALINLGSTEVPQSYWRPLEREESALVDFGKTVEIQNCYYYPGVGLGRVDLSPSEDGTNFSGATRLNIGGFDMYTWQKVQFTCNVRYVRITALDSKVLINELSFLDASGKLIPIESVTSLTSNATSDATALFDEQQYVDLQPDFMTEMYFDEVYHARTAFEHLHGFAPYENTHPPLGKVFIMLGVWIFGMNPFGWRIVGTLFGIFMLPLLYVFAKRLFRDTRCAAVACFLFAVDGMHFAQTRIATIDVYGVFFIIAMCYFMFRYWQMNFFVDDLKKTFVPLGFAGIMFGIGSASKWIGLYEGLGLAVAFFTSLFLRYREYCRAKSFLPSAEGEEAELCTKVVKTFWPNTIKTCAFCVVFFILIPIGIYLLSYLPYMLCAEKPYSLKDVWGVQTYMFDYHSHLTATHPFQSPWYTWPLDIKPIYYFAGEGLPEGTMQAIAAFGNPAVWWAGFVCFVVVMVLLILKRVEGELKHSYVFLLISLGAAFLPWTLITRATFIYHYFASVPFIILLTASLILYRKKRGLPIWVWGLCAVSLLLFGLFYPVWSGLEISRKFALTFMRWMQSWWFFS